PCAQREQGHDDAVSSPGGFSAGMTQEPFQSCQELKRLRSIKSISVKHSVIKNYLEIMLELPWSSFINLTNQAVVAK
ncbi:uncharacterized protein VP01_15080g1, partial [Puccinia sorghi]